MTIPGFTAENALYMKDTRYNTNLSAQRISSGVIPQAGVRVGAGTGGQAITIEPEQCQIRCRWVCTRYGCFPTNCYESCF
jgi:hypothetical protein